MSKRRLNGMGRQIIDKIQEYQREKKEEEDRLDELANDVKSQSSKGPSGNV
jgi:cell division septum initiation protein DivIVA